MTDHAQLSRDLAMALGYAPESVLIDTDKQGKYEPVCRVYRISYDMGPYWRWFDYRHPDVVLPLIEWLMREYGGFFTRDVIGPHQVWYLPRCFPGMPDRSYPTLAEAVARAVIAAKGGG